LLKQLTVVSKKVFKLILDGQSDYDAQLDHILSVQVINIRYHYPMCPKYVFDVLKRFRIEILIVNILLFGAMPIININLSHMARKLHACNLSQKVLAEKQCQDSIKFL
jgi:hypothetical protein